MNTAMPLFLPRIVRVVFAVCFLVAGGSALAEEEEGFSEGWFEERELEMTQHLTSEIEVETSESVSRNVVQRLIDADTLPEERATPPQAPPAALDPTSGDEAAVPTLSEIPCEAGAEPLGACFADSES